MSTNVNNGRGGVVVNVSSMAGRTERIWERCAGTLCSLPAWSLCVCVFCISGLYPISYAPVYCASKFGVVAFTRCLEVSCMSFATCMMPCHSKNGPTQNWSVGPILSIKIGSPDHFCPSNPVRVGPILFIKNGLTHTNVVLPGPLLPCKICPTRTIFVMQKRSHSRASMQYCPCICG